ncbi:hypothetical protein DP23_4383 [Ralstonia pickettii]|nr:hypothetical protein DP23_4383 [Ralstonia pickettii]
MASCTPSKAPGSDANAAKRRLSAREKWGINPPKSKNPTAEGFPTPKRRLCYSPTKSETIYLIRIIKNRLVLND